MKSGKDFEDRIAKRLKRAGCFVQKLYDAPAAFGPDREVLPGARTAFTPKNPYDFIVTLDAGEECRGGVRLPTYFNYALECKTTKGKRFDVNSVKPHQLKGLLAFPGVSGVVVELREVTRCFFVRPRLIRNWERLNEKKSMNLADLEANAVELPHNTSSRETRNYYDVSPILKGGQK